MVMVVAAGEGKRAEGGGRGCKVRKKEVEKEEAGDWMELGEFIFYPR